MAKYKIYVNGSNQQQNNAQQNQQQIVQQLAQNAANQTLAQNTNEPDLRETVDSLIKNKLLQNIEVPQYTTIKDVLSAPKGSKLDNFVDFLQNPETVRTIGNLLPSYGYNPKTGKVENSQENYAQRIENEMHKKQNQALLEQKEQNDLAQAMANAYNRQDLAKEELEWKREEAALDRGLKREQMAQQLKIAGMIHGGGGGSATGGAAGYKFKPSDIRGYKNDFKKDKAISDYALINSKTQDINAIKNKFKGSGRLNAADQALIMNFNKTLDPISVVRESEFARTAAGQSIIDRAEGAMIKLAKGGSGLSRAERDAIYDVFDVMQSSAKNRAKIVTQEYYDFADRYGINPKDIIMEYSSLLENETPTNSVAPSGNKPKRIYN